MAIDMAKDTSEEFHTLKEFNDELDLLFRDDVALRKLLQKSRNWCIRNNRPGDEEEVLQEAVTRVMKSEITGKRQWPKGVALIDFLSGVMLAVGIRLVDFKIEIGRIYDGDFMRLIIADEISPDSCRLWDIETGQKLDKDVFRRDLGNLADAYTEVARRLGVMPKNASPISKPTLIN